MNSLNLTSYAKLNLYLEVLGKRPDNYHSIFTLFERVSLYDQIRLKPLPQGVIRIASSHPCIPLGRKNLVYQAASLLRKEFGIHEGVEININKRIPISAGLAGGSSNAAVVLSGLNKLWKLNLRARQLVNLARQIGSDVPFFLHNCSFAYATQRGDEIKALSLPVKLWHIIVVPPIKISSSLVYKRWDESTGAPGLTPTPIDRGREFKSPRQSMGKRDRSKLVWGLTKRQLRIKILKAALLRKDRLLLGKLLFNSLEQVSIALHPVINKVKSALYDAGLQAILMSGSGPAVFGLVSSRKEAHAVARQLKAKKRNWDVFVAKTI